MRHILIVDDEKFLAKNLAELVDGTKEWESSIAHTAEEAIELVTMSHFDALLLDLYLPDLEGVELGKRLTKINPLAQIIYMSAYPENIKKLKTTVGDLESILEKPFDFNRLHDILNHLI
jgi:DNA-binding NtrC family response regulator